jgi:hypothetical protein
MGLSLRSHVQAGSQTNPEAGECKTQQEAVSKFKRAHYRAPTEPAIL